MSCHDIGRGLNNVVRKTVALMDDGKISKDAAKEIIRCCTSSVHWCDGNVNEAYDYIRDCMCGRCMRKLPKGEKMYAVNYVSWDVPDTFRLARKFANDKLCKECFDKVLGEHCNDYTRGPKERAYIEKNWDEKDYTSTGEYSRYNNGFPWGD